MNGPFSAFRASKGLVGSARTGAERALVSLGRRIGLPIQWTREWAVGLYEGDSPLRLRPVSGLIQPIMSARHAPDLPARFMADPFWIRDGSDWFLFMEVLNGRTGRGAIGLASSIDGRNWKYRGIVVEEPFHQSYPCVFRSGSQWFMTPSGLGAGGILLYRAVDFPTRWIQVKRLIDGPFADPTVVFHEGRWFMFVAVGFDELRLFSADSVDGSWTEHPSSPLIQRDPGLARPGGRVISAGGRLYRFAQDCRLRYGHMVNAIEIVQLSATEYAERAIKHNPILMPESGWNGGGMHHIDAIELTVGHWMAVVDGWRFKPGWRAERTG